MSAMDVFWSWPPVTRTMVAASFALSICAYTGFVKFEWILCFPQAIWRIPPQLWRIPTSFLLTGPKLSIFFDPYFLFTYGGSLEQESPRFTDPGSYFCYILFNAAVILGLAGHYLGGVTFMSALILALAYTYSQDNSERQTTFFIITFSSKYLPYALLSLTFIMDSPGAAKAQATGLLSAHLYDFLTRIWPTFGGGFNVLQTPNFVKRAFAGVGRRPAERDRGFGTSRAAAAAQPPPGGWSNQRGPGRRLG